LLARFVDVARGAIHLFGSLLLLRGLFQLLRGFVELLLRGFAVALAQVLRGLLKLLAQLRIGLCRGLRHLIQLVGHALLRLGTLCALLLGEVAQLLRGLLKFTVCQ
jgi:hypothetical protein